MYMLGISHNTRGGGAKDAREVSNRGKVKELKLGGGKNAELLSARFCD